MQNVAYLSGAWQWYNSSMRKIIIIIVLAAVIVGIGWAVDFYRRNLQGAFPAFAPTHENIADVINTTGMPLVLPPGFTISIFAKDVPGARVMTRDPSGTLLVSEPDAKRVVALPDEDGDGKADGRITVLGNVRKPHGLAFKCEDECLLYVGEENALVSYSYDSKTHTAKERKKHADLPGDGGHSTRSLLFMPAPDDHILLVSVGSSCNVCNEVDNRRAKIFAYNTRTSEFKEFARGLRNSVFMAIHPVTGKIWATEMGRDLLGDDLPPDEINVIERGKNYGWPICYGKNMHDTDFDTNTYIRNPCMEPLETSSFIDIPAHSAPLGLAFFGEEGWPEEYWHDMLVAHHGSWNRSTPTGYKIVRYQFDESGTLAGTEDFIYGWLKGNEALGRPVDIMIEPGKIYISDDKAGVIYLVRYNPN